MRTPFDSLSIQSPFSRAFGGIEALSHIWLDQNVEYTGTPAAVTEITCGGSLELTAAIAGSGTEVQIDNGVKVGGGGKYLNIFPVSGAYDEAVIVIDFTRTSGPNGSTGEVINLDNTGSERTRLRYRSAYTEALLPQLGFESYAARNFGDGDRNTLAVHVDYINDTATLIEYDGLERVIPLDAATSQLNLSQILIGQNCNITIHQLGVFLAEPGGSLVKTPRELWGLVSGEGASPYTAGAFAYIPAIGQSLELGVNPADKSPTTEADLEYENRPAVLQMDGLKTAGGVDVQLHGSGSDVINQAVAATGFQSLDVRTRAPSTFLAALTNAEVRAPYGLSVPRQIVQTTAISGEDAHEFDADTPVTGTLGTAFINNTDYVASEAKRLIEADGGTFSIPILKVLQGEADINLAAGEYYSRMKVSIDDNLAAINAITGVTPAVYMYQTAGGKDMDGLVTGEVSIDQLDLVAHYSGVLVGPLYPYALSDYVHPTFEESRKLSDLSNWAWAEVDAGNDWNLIPSASLDGTTVTVTATCRGDESLEIAPDRYAGQGIDSYAGFEVTGANITGISVSGSTVTLTCDAVPTDVRYAFQKQDSTSFTDTYGGHRGLIRTTLTKTVDGRALYRYLPSFRIDL